MSAKTDFSVVAFGRGFVVAVDTNFLTKAEEAEDPFYRCPQAFTIRVWGTKNGLGELSARGPTRETIIDAVEFPMRIPRTAVHLIMDCSPVANEGFRIGCAAATKTLLSK